MTLEVLKNSNKVIGIKQVTKTVQKNLAKEVFIALDAEDKVTVPLRELCAAQAVEIVEVATMLELGRACGIEVGSATAATLL